MHRLIGLGSLVLLFALPSIAFAQTEDVCGSDERTAAYTDYYNKKKKGDAPAQKEAYGLGKQYLQKWSQCNDQYSQAVQKFVAAYEAANAETDLRLMVFGANPNYPQAMELGKKVLANKPDDLNTLMTLGYAGYLALTKGNKALAPDAITYLRKSLELIDAGKTPPNWNPFKSKEEAIGLINFSLGEFTSAANNDAAGSLPYYVKAATIEGPTKKLAVVYGRLAMVYEGIVEQLNKDYNTTYGGKPETDQSKAAFEKVNQAVDRLIDYYARAVNLAGNDPQLAAHKASWLERLTVLYKLRHEDKTDGLEAMMSNVINTPLPPP
jgi:tetratricopeptide (TPR) repeat protein